MKLKPKMKEYTVAIQVIKGYWVNVKAKSEEDAITKVEEMQSDEIEEKGSIVSVETDHAVVW